MPTNSNLLKEAIVDAKAVRATSLANAKMALEEAFNQRFSAVFADKLREDSATEAEAQPVAETTEKDPVGATKPSKSDGTVSWSKDNSGNWKADSSKATPTTVSKGKDGGDATKKWSDGNIAPGGKPEAKDVTPKLKEGYEEEEEGKKEEESVEETVTNEDLDEIIKELEAEAGGGDQMTDPAAGGAPEGGAPGEEQPPMEPEAPGEEATEIHSGDTVTISKVEAPGGAPEAPAPEAPGAEGMPPEGEAGAGAPPMEEEDIDLNELLASLNEESKEDEKEEEKEEEKEKKDMDEALKTQLSEVASQRDEAYKTVEYLRVQINEINLLNAKLLYTNKLFKEFGMNRDQKTKVVEAFDLTKNVREVKMTYANWCESLNFGGSSKRMVQPRPTTMATITEGKASKTVASTKPSNLITEGVSEEALRALRYQKLAGIKVKK